MMTVCSSHVDMEAKLKVTVIEYADDKDETRVCIAIVPTYNSVDS